jgi:hypothetical protein
LLCTDLEAEPERIISWFVRCWRMDATFSEEARQNVSASRLRGTGLRRRSGEALRRSAPALLGLFSVVTLFANQRMANENVDTVRRAAWYDKNHPTFSDALALARRELWAREEATFCGSAQENDMVIPFRGSSWKG